MKAYLPPFCKPLGYVFMGLALIAPFVLAIFGYISDANFLIIKESTKLILIFSACLILFAYNREEDKTIEKLRSLAARDGILLTTFFLFGGMLYHIYTQDSITLDTSSFLIFLILQVLSLEYRTKKYKIEKKFQKR